MDQPSYIFTPRYLSGNSAWVGHLPFAYDLIKTVKPGLIVELGTWMGDSFFTMCQSVADHKLRTVCYAVDHWKGDEQAGEVTGDAQYAVVDGYAASNYSEFSFTMRTDFQSASNEFTDGSIDLVHIDGYHSCEAVTQDFDTWYPKVKEGGVMLFHDIMVRTSEGRPDFGVWRFWDGMKAKYKTWQFSHGFGLGVFIKGDNPSIESWFDKATTGELGEYYAKRGNDMTQLSACRSLTSKAKELNQSIQELNKTVANQKQEIERLSQHSANLEQLVRSLDTEKRTTVEKLSEHLRSAKSNSKKLEKTERQNAQLREKIIQWNRGSFIRRAIKKIRL